MGTPQRRNVEKESEEQMLKPDIDCFISLDIVTKRGYPSETHQVTTSDGYILTIYRIPHGKTTKKIANKPVLLQHGMFSSSHQFLVPPATHGLGYVLADNGYDVWLGNFRGTEYSRNHTSLDPDRDSKFWHFSWHELGMFDLPAMIDYILNLTDQAKLHYVGHSQGTTAFYVLATTRPEYNTKIKAQISLAPAAYVDHVSSPVLRKLASLLDPITILIEKLKINEIGSSKQFVFKVLKELCRRFQTKCISFISTISEFNLHKLNTDMSILINFALVGGSVRQALHYLQEVNSKSFGWYDYKENNFRMYGTVRPPAYNLSLVTTPSYLFYSRGDAHIGERDVFRLCRKIRGACLEQFLMPGDDFSHADFILGISAPELVYQKILGVLRKHYT